MIRRANYADVPAIFRLMQEMHAASNYATLDDIDEKHAKGLIVSCIQRDGLQSDGGTMVVVAEQDGSVTGFIIGVLDRVYHIGRKLMATDLFTYNSAQSGSPFDALKLFDALIAWAEGIPAVAEIKLGAVDVIHDFERSAKIYRRRGFTQAGAIFQRSIAR